MRAKITIAGAALILGVAGAASAAPFTLTSPDIKSNGPIAEKQEYNSFGCSGQNVSPALEWKNAPAGTKSFVLMVHDPDAPTGGSGLWHWVVYNIPADATSLPAGAGSEQGTGLPKGAVQVHNDLGSVGYVGPCPPPGAKHKYNFTLYALKVDKIDVPPTASAAVIGFNANMNAIGKPAKLTGTFARKKEPAPPPPAEKPAPAKK